MSENKILDEFVNEFSNRVDRLSGVLQQECLPKEIILVLVENLLLKYNNRIEEQNGIFSRLFPFLRKSSYDPEVEREVEQRLKRLVEQVDSSTNSLVHVEDNTILSQLEKAHGGSDQDPYSKTNLPSWADLAMILDPLPGKGQDHLDLIVSPHGDIGMIICDGVSGDGSMSTMMAQHIPKVLGNHLKTHFRQGMSISDWKKTIRMGLEKGVSSFAYEGGSSTVIVALIDVKNELLYTAWMGDGHLLYFNEQHTGFSKLLTPHQNGKGQLTSVVTANGLLGDFNVQIISAAGGMVILSSDGYHLSNGRILRHLFQKIAKAEDINQALEDWNSSCCGDEQVHPAPHDDRSIGVIRW